MSKNMRFCNFDSPSYKISIRDDYSGLEINKVREAKFAVYERGSRVQKW